VSIPVFVVLAVDEKKQRGFFRQAGSGNAGRFKFRREVFFLCRGNLLPGFPLTHRINGFKFNAGRSAVRGWSLNPTTHLNAPLTQCQDDRIRDLVYLQLH
jgi:hypothetical protein